MNLTLQFMTYSELEDLTSLSRVQRLIDLVKQNKIVLLEGRLRKEEEIDLIKTTMEQIDEKFKGVEIGTIEPSQKKEISFLASLKDNVADLLFGERRGITIIGPASVVREIKQDPEKIQLFTHSGAGDVRKFKASSKLSVSRKKRR